MTTTTWLGLASGAWQSEDNWSAGEPGPGSTILITVAEGTTPPPYTPVLANAAIDQGTLDLEGGSVTLDNVTLGGTGGGLLVNVTGNPSAPGAGSFLVAQHIVTLDSNATVDIAAVSHGIGGNLDVAGTDTSSGVENDGVINNGNVFENDCTLINNGTVLDGIVYSYGAVTGDGTIEGGTPEFFNDVASSQTIGPSGVISLYEYDVALGGTGTFSGQIVDMLPGSQIFIATVSNVSVVSYAGGVLNLSSSAGPISIDASGPGVTSFTVDNSPSGAYLTAACYAAGTRLLTERGERPIEQIRAGERLMTVDGAAPELQTVRWVGRRHVDLVRHPHPKKVAPVRIRAHAFADALPRRDLLVSPDHALLIGGALVPAYLLCNGATIVREPGHASITYWHVEFDRHTLVVAEGLAAESYLDTGNRAAFDNAGAVQMLYPDFLPRRWDRDACRRLLLGGNELLAAHALLLSRAEALGWRRTSDPAPRLLADDRVVRPAASDLGLWRFRLPRGARELRLQSRVFVPSENDRAADDHRRLGLPVVAVRADGAPVPLGGPGWHPAEHGWRWTDGNAALVVPPGTTSVDLRTQHGWGRYWVSPRPPARRRRPARQL